MLTEKMIGVVKTTQIITQINTIQWHNSYKTTNKVHFPVIVLKGVWLGA